MLDLNFVRDNLPLVEEKLRQRGMDPGAGAERFPSGRHPAPPGHHRSRDHESAAQPRLRRDRQAEKERPGRDRADCRNQGTARADPATGESGGRSRSQSAGDSHRHPQSAARKRAGRQDARRQCRSAALGRAAQIRFHAQAALGTGRTTGRSRSRTRHQTFRRALRRVLGPGREAGAGAGQLHARSAHPRARLHRSAAALPGEFRVHVWHRAVAEICRRPLSACRTAKKICG